MMVTRKARSYNPTCSIDSKKSVARPSQIQRMLLASEKGDTHVGLLPKGHYQTRERA